MRAIAVKEFRQLRRDRRTVAMLFLLPFLFLVVFGYAASFDIKDVPTSWSGPARRWSRGTSPAVRRRRHAADGDAAPARERCAAARPSSPSSRRRGGGTAQVLIDGTELFAAQAALRSLAELQARTPPGQARQSAARRRRRRRRRSTSSSTPTCAPRSS